MSDRNVLAIAQTVTDVVGLSSIGALVNNQDPTARTMLGLFNRAGRNLTRMRNTWGAGWAVLTREFVFETVPDRREYEFPDDFEALIDGTVWDRDTYREARGTLSPQQWQQVRSGLIQTVAISPLYRIARSAEGTGRVLVLEPVPAERETLVLEYVSRNWLRDPAGSAFRNMIAGDTDVPLFDDDLMELDLTWRFKQSRGLTFAAELAEFEMERDRRLADDAGARAITIGRRGRARGYWPNTAQTGFGRVA